MILRVTRILFFIPRIAHPTDCARDPPQCDWKTWERYGDVLVLAPGKVVEKPVNAGLPQFTWEEFSVMDDTRIISSQRTET